MRNFNYAAFFIRLIFETRLRQEMSSVCVLREAYCFNIHNFMPSRIFVLECVPYVFDGFMPISFCPQLKFSFEVFSLSVCKQLRTSHITVSRESEPSLSFSTQVQWVLSMAITWTAGVSVLLLIYWPYRVRQCCGDLKYGRPNDLVYQVDFTHQNSIRAV